MKTAIALLLCASVAYADPPATAEKTQLKTVEIVNGETFAAVPLHREWASVAAKFPGATYERTHDSLRVSANVEGIKRGTILAVYVLRSDCPNNSIFQERVNILADRSQLESALVAWTQHRHDVTAPAKSVRNLDRDRVDVTLDFQPHWNPVSAK